MNSFSTQPADLAQPLLAYLKKVLGSDGLIYASPLTKLVGGYSTSTHVFQFKLGGIDGLFARSLVLRFYAPHLGKDDALFEAAVQEVLCAEGVPVPDVHHICTDLSVLGGAFFLMDLIPGHQLIAEPSSLISEVLGSAHANLHAHDAMAISTSLAERGIDVRDYGLDSQIDWLEDRIAAHGWTHEITNWIRANRPEDPECMAIGHRDFHALNVLYDGDKVTGIVDWPGFLIIDPAFDVANTFTLLAISAKHMGGDFASLKNMPETDASTEESLAAHYLAAYESRRPLDRTNFDYYRILRSTTMIMRGVLGAKTQQNPLAVADHAAFIEGVAGIHLSVPQA